MNLLRHAVLGSIVVALLCPALHAQPAGKVALTCPLDGTQFEVSKEYSGTAFSRRLDLKQVGPNAVPLVMNQCPTCRFPMFKESYTSEDIHEFKAVVATPEFIAGSKDQSAYVALALIKEQLKADAMSIAWNYLQASWEIETKDAKSYPVVLQRSIAWFDRAAVELKGDRSKRDTWQMANYLPIELSRRIGDFDGAAKRLAAITWARPTEIKWLAEALRMEAEFVKQKDKGDYEIPEPTR